MFRNLGGAGGRPLSVFAANLGLLLSIGLDENADVMVTRMLFRDGHK